MTSSDAYPIQESPDRRDPIPRHARVYLAGHRGLVGSALLRRLLRAGFHKIMTRTHEELDLTRQEAVEDFFSQERPDYVLLAAAKVGGIRANATRPAEFIYQNLAIQSNVVHAAYLHGVQRLLFLGSSCIYPRLAGQPMAEEALLTGPLEPTNEPYAVAKIAGIKLCESYNRQRGTDFRSVMPTNLYGPNDNFDLQTSHVVPALLRKFHEAKVAGRSAVEVWGTGRPRREFLHVDDLADACLFVLELDRQTHARHTEPMRSHLNVGTGADVSIAELADTVRRVVGFAGEIRFDSSMPDGAPRKLLDVTRITALGWRPRISLEAGLKSVYRWFVGQLSPARSQRPPVAAGTGKDNPP
jgi:GDP-L-fucose synthase